MGDLNRWDVETQVPLQCGRSEFGQNTFPFQYLHSAQERLRKTVRSRNREVEHVPAYSHSNGRVGIVGAWRDEWIVAGEIRSSQGNRDYRRRTIQLARCGIRGNWGNRQTFRANEETLCERAEPRLQCGSGGRRVLRYDPGGTHATL